MRNEHSYLWITMGDAAGIGPEIILMSLSQAYPKACYPVLIGSFTIFERAAKVIHSPLVLNRIHTPIEGDFRPEVINILDTEKPTPEDAPFGILSGAAGRGTISAIKKAYEISKTHPTKAILSAPMNKQSIHDAGFSYIDECELMSQLTGAPSPMMLLVSQKLRMATIPPLHVSLKKACENITAEGVFNSLTVIRNALVSFGIQDPVIGVAALNPHGGEGGQYGEEELSAIIPGIERGKNLGWDIRGPFPPDSFFYLASKEGFDGVLTMYHDQGRIAMKTSDFGRIVIVMIGLPIPFVTVAHGTAFGRAGKGTADPGNFIEALNFTDSISPQ